jgi:hypothetical protein
MGFFIHALGSHSIMKNSSLFKAENVSLDIAMSLLNQIPCCFRKRG